MTATTVPHLRPLGMGQLLDQAVRLYRRNFLTFIGIIAIVQIPVALLQFVFSLLTIGGVAQLQDPSAPFPASGEMFGPAFATGIGGTVLVGIIAFVLIQVVATAAMTRAVAGSYLGETVSILGSYRKIKRSWVSLLGALLLSGLIGIVLFIWLLIPCVGWLTGLGMMLFFVMVIIPLIAPVIVLERQKASQAIRRAWDLARRRFWWVLGFVFLLYIFAQIIITGPAYLVTLIFQLSFGIDTFGSPATQMIMQTTIQSIVQVVGALIYLPLQLTAITLMYFDLRVRTEGFDLTLLTADRSDETDAASEISEITTQAPKPDSGNLVTMNEMGYFVLIELAIVAFYVALMAVLYAVVFSVMSVFGPGF